MYKYGADNESVKFKEWVRQFEDLFKDGWEEEKEKEENDSDVNEYRLTKAMVGVKVR